MRGVSFVTQEGIDRLKKLGFKHEPSDETVLLGGDPLREFGQTIAGPEPADDAQVDETDAKA